MLQSEPCYPVRILSDLFLKMHRVVQLMFLASMFISAPAMAQLVINEIMQNPSAVSDGAGEWFELHNPTGSAVDIDGWTIQDNDVDSHVIDNGGPLLVPAGGYLVLGNNANSGTNGGVTVAYQYSGIALANGGDELVLLDGSLAEIDRVEWDGGPAFPDPTGASMALSSPALDNNVGANWCTASTAFGAGDSGTPGAANDCGGPIPELVINEILQNPSAVSDGSGEWFELYNPTGSAIDIDGWTISDNGTNTHLISNGGPLLVPAGGFLVLGINSDSLTNGGVSVDYQYSNMFLGNSDDELILTDALTNEIDRVEWDGGPAFPDPNGASMALSDPGLDNNVGANWCTASTPFGAGDLGTPGAANDCVTEAPELVINEIMQNPSAVSDGSGEWFELYNPTGSDVDIDGWTIQDNDTDSHVIDNGGPLLVPTGGYLVLGNNADSGTNGGVTVGYQYSGVFLGNSADELVLLSGSLVEIDRVEWDDGATFPDPTGAAMALDDPSSDNNDGSNWCEASTTFGAGDFGTPGAANDCPVTVPVLVISEIIQNPSAVSDSNGEWFELYNPTGSAIDIDGWTVQDNDFDSFVINNGGPLLVPAGGFLVLGNNADSGTNGGVTVGYQYSGMFLSNSSDELVLLSDSLAEIDRVEWDNGATFPDPNGASMSLAGPALDNNDGSNWCTATTPFGAGDLGTPGAANDCGSTGAELVINEILQNPAAVGDADGEWFELFNTTWSAIDIDGWTVQDNDFDSFVINNGGPLLVPAGGFLVLGNNANFGTNGGVTVGYQYSGMFLSNSSDELVLLNGSLVEIDRVEWDNGATFPDPNGASMSLVSPVLDNNVGGNWCTAITPFGAGDLGTPGAATDCELPLLELEIFEIQGNGAASAYDGQFVATLDNIVTAVGPEGFFMQTPDARADADADTSNGIYVFTGGAPGVAVGDQVDVTGEVDEFFEFTEFTAGPIVTVDSSGNPLPAATLFDATVPSPDPTAPSCAVEFECYEGMLIEITGGTVAGPNQRFGTDPVAEVHITAANERPFREPGIEFPGLFGYPEWDGNPEVFEMDADKLGLPNDMIPAGSRFDAIGVLGFEFGGYELWPTSLDVTPAPLPDPVRANLPGELTVGTLNLFRLFDDIDDPPDLAADGRVRDDVVVSTAEYMRRLNKFAAHIVDVLGAPDILAVQEAESLGVLEDLAAAIGVHDATVTYAAHLVEGNDLGTIDVGFLTRAHIQVDAITQLGKDEFYENPMNLELEILHDRPPLLLEGHCTLDYGVFPIAVMTVHNRSLSGIDGSEAERVRQKRYEQAVSIAGKVQALQDADPAVRLVVVGDFNDYEFTDGYVDAVGIITGDHDPTMDLVCATNACPDIVEPNLTNEVLGMPALDRYSFIFRGTAQVLDHALTTQGLDGEMTGAEYGRGNADAAVDLINQDAPADVIPLRSSDHDGLVVYILKDEDNDGVPNDDDMCPGTVIPEGVPMNRLGVNRFALSDADGVFDTTPPEGEGPGASFTIGDTAGCSCEQIATEQGLGKGHAKFGCSIGEMEEWVDLVSQP